MLVYYIGTDLDTSNIKHAGAKAPDDIEEICRKAGYHKISIHVFMYKTIFQKIWSVLGLIYQWLQIGRRLPKNAVVIYQHPMHGAYVAEKAIPIIKKWKKSKFVCIIHDLDSLRFATLEDGKRKKYIADHKLLKYFDCLICHNEYMKEYLIKQGIPADKLVCLEIFDYLTDQDVKDEQVTEYDVLNNKQTIVIAGNLTITKCAYIYKIKEHGQNAHLKINLYGNGYDESKTLLGMDYRGAYKPAELVKYLEGGFGLVWDGTSAETCAGGMGEYLRYNNPHKTSLYLASGMPVIVWKEAAIADFVVKNGVGIAVQSLESLDKVLQDISEDEYKSMCDNARTIGQKIREGKYFTTALQKAIEVLSDEGEMEEYK